MRIGSTSERLRCLDSALARWLECGWRCGRRTHWECYHARADTDGGAVCGRRNSMDSGGGSMFNLAFDFMAALSVILLAACFYQVFKMAEEEQKQEAKRNERF